jgi:hypothetical protein
VLVLNNDRRDTPPAPLPRHWVTLAPEAVAH